MIATTVLELPQGLEIGEKLLWEQKKQINTAPGFIRLGPVFAMTMKIEIISL